MTNGTPQGLFILRSSAGAGKTHALVKHYLKACLCDPGPDAYRRVLALTFTNKAAREMRDRVLHYLAGLANGNTRDARLADVRHDLVSAAGINDTELARRTRAMHQHMLHNWPQVAISTIDAFTRRITKPFARDLQLDQDLEMTTEQDRYLQLAIDDLLSAASSDTGLTRILAEACVQLLEEEQRWNAREPLLQLAKVLGNENAYVPLTALRGRSPEEVVAMAAELRKRTSAFRSRMRAMGEEALAILRHAGIAPEELHFKEKGVYSWFKKLAQFDDNYLPMAISREKDLHEGKLAGKVDAASAARINSFAPILADLHLKADHLAANGYNGYVIASAVLAQLMPTAALQALDEHLTHVKAVDGVAFFSDLTRKVAELVREEPASFIHERIGERYRHYLIDEFQDTSRMQWQSLLPLVENALSNGGSALLVGDAKQAIYRWRNGDARQFIALPHLYGRAEIDDGEEREAYLINSNRVPEALPFNYRSARAVVDFNNRLFDRLGAMLPEGFRHVYAEQQQTAKRSTEGLVTVRMSEKSDRDEPSDSIQQQFLLDSLTEALSDGYAPCDVAVLVHTHAHGKLVTRWLSAAGYTVTSPDGLMLGGDPAAECMIDLFRAVHTNDTAAGMRALQSMVVLNDRSEGTTTNVRLSPTDDPLNTLHSMVERLRALTARYPLYGQLRAIAEHVNLRATDDAHVLFLLDEAHSFSTAHGNDPLDFLAHWDRTGRVRTVQVPATTTAVHVLTVHKAKGLEFPIVVIPFPERRKGNHPSPIWIKPGAAVADLPYALVNDGRAVMELPLPEIREEADQRVLDKLDQLYVAFTRAEDRLYVLVQSGSTEAFLKELLTFAEEQGTADGVLRLGTRATVERAHDLSAGAAIQQPHHARNSPLLSMRLEAPEHWDPADPDPFRSRGTAVHAVIARMRTADDLPAALSDAAERGELTAEEAEALLPDLTALLRREDLEPWFGPDRDVRSEATLITVDGHAVRPDRLAMETEGIRVLDIKTGAPAEQHHVQVKHYMDVLSSTGHPVASGHLLYIASGRLVAVTH